MKQFWSAIMLVVTIGCDQVCQDSNATPKFGSTGMPANCRAIIQANIDGWRARQFTAEEAFSSIERNCGATGYAWGK